MTVVQSLTLWPHELQHAKLPCPSLSSSVCSNSCPLSQWCHPTISFYVSPFSSCPQSSPASGSFLMTRLFTSGSQNIGASASAWILPMNIQGWFLLGQTALISLQSKGLSRVFSNTTVRKHQFFTGGTQKGGGNLGYRKNIYLKHLVFVDQCVVFSNSVIGEPWGYMSKH